MPGQGARDCMARALWLGPHGEAGGLGGRGCVAGPSLMWL